MRLFQHVSDSAIPLVQINVEPTEAPSEIEAAEASAHAFGRILGSFFKGFTEATAPVPTFTPSVPCPCEECSGEEDDEDEDEDDED